MCTIFPCNTTGSVSRSLPCHSTLLKGPASNHGYWQTKGSIGLNGHSYKSTDSPTCLLFLPSTAAWLPLIPSLSQPITFPATAWAEAQLSIGLLCCVNDKEMQWEPLNRSMWRSFFEIHQVLFSKPRLCKSPSTPSITSLLPCALTPSTNSHSRSELLTLACAPPVSRGDAFPQFPDDESYRKTMGGIYSGYKAS